MSPILPITVDRHAASPLYRQLELQLRAAIEERRLRPGQRLPSVRALAAQLGIGKLTAATAYEQLAADGYVVGRVGFGTVVAPYAPDARDRYRATPRGAGPRRKPKPGPAPLPPLHVAPGLHVDAVTADGWPPASSTPRFDLRPGPPGGADLAVSPILERTLRDAWRSLGGASVTTEPAGDPMLRAAIASHLRASRGARCELGSVVILSGAVIALSTVARLWLHAGSTVVVEEPGDPVVRRALSLSGARVLAVPSDGHGLRPDALPPAATVAVVAPGVQVPTGSAMPLARRLRLLDWASGAGAIVVEDGRSDDLVLRGSPTACLQGLDEDGRVISLGAFESILHPGVRLAWAVVPPELVPPFVATVAAIDPGPSPVQQRALARFLADGHLDRHLARVRRTLLERQDRLLAAIGRELGWLLSVEPAAGGTRLVMSVEDERWTALSLARTAAEAGVLVEPVPGPADGAERRLVIDYGRAVAVDLVRAVHVLAAAVGAADRMAPRAVAARDTTGRVRAVRPVRTVPARNTVSGRPGLVAAMSAAGFRPLRQSATGRDDAA